jgi:hypothetical protein
MIVIRWGAAPKNAAIEAALDPVGDWLRFDAHAYLIRTESAAKQIFDAVAAVLTKADQELIMKVDPSEYYGWIQPWVGDWIEGKPYKES